MTIISHDVYHPETDNRNATRAILIVTGDNTEDLEFFYPYYRFIEAGYRVDVATPVGGAFKGIHGLGLKETLKIADVVVGNYDMLYLPGGKAPAKLMKDENALAVTQKFYSLGKPIAAVCHGPQILAAADIIMGQEIAAWPGIESEVSDANATYINKEVVVSGPFVTARMPGDLPAHMRETLEVLNHGKSILRATGLAA